MSWDWVKPALAATGKPEDGREEGQLPPLDLPTPEQPPASPAGPMPSKKQSKPRGTPRGIKVKAR